MSHLQSTRGTASCPLARDLAVQAKQTGLPWRSGRGEVLQHAYNARRMSESEGRLPPAFGGSSLEAQLELLDVVGAVVTGARWTDGLRHFELDLRDGRTLRFEECLQASYSRSPALPEQLAMTAWWTDEPSPLVQSLAPEIRFSFEHAVFELGDSLLRIAFRRLLVSEA